MKNIIPVSSNNATPKSTVKHFFSDADIQCTNGRTDIYKSQLLTTNTIPLYSLILVVFVVLCVIAVFILDAGLLARSQYSEGPVTGHLDTGFSWFPCVYKQMLRWFPRFQVATACF